MKKILIVDDAADIVTSLVDLLEESGYQTFSALKAPPALKLVKDLIPDLILCDVFMPEMNGYEFIEALKADPATAGIPVIILSAGADKANVEKGRNAGVFDFVIKPYNSLDLLVLINKALGD
jgi:CheY-like chemotaxis protein